MQMFGGTLVFASLIPPDARQACDAGSGNTWFVQLATGAAEFVASTVGIPATPVILQTGAALHGAFGSQGRGGSESAGRVLVPGPTGTQTIDAELRRNTSWGQLSWRRIHNYQALKNAGS